MTLTSSDPRFWDLVDPDAALTTVGHDFTFTEGPVWHPRENHLTFSDMPGDVRRRLQAGDVVEVMRPANKCNGLTYDGELNLLVCEHSTSTVVREGPDGSRETLASHFEGRELNSPNDIVVRRDGSIYFSDPWYGRMPGFGVERPREMGFQGLYRISPSGELELAADRDLFDQPNGLCFSPDESLLYVNDTTHACIWVFEVGSDGTLAGGEIFADGICDDDIAGVPDGMKCDEHGNIWVTGPGGVHVFDPSATHLGVVEVDEVVANLAWGGPNWRVLYLAASTTVRALPTKVGPHRELFMDA